MSYGRNLSEVSSLSHLTKYAQSSARVTEFSAEQGGAIPVELLLLPDARLQGSNHHVRTARESLPQRRRVQGEQI